jgi:outer membrane receptor protein involved in Fe transport
MIIHSASMQANGLRILLAASVGAMALTIGLPAYAQSPSQAERGAGIEEIIVTARKREESLQDVPVTVTALSERFLQEAGIFSGRDIAKFTPGYHIEDIGVRYFDKPTIRGLSTASVTPADQKSSVYVDGVFVSGSFSTISLQDLQRVEVLKGPQSATFGRATFGGAVNYITKDPGNEFEGRVSARLATDAEYNLTALISGPIVADRLSALISGSLYRYGAPKSWRNSLGGEKLGKEATQSLSGKLLWQPTDTFQARLRAFYSHDEDSHNAIQFVDTQTRTGRFVDVTTGVVRFFPVGKAIEPTSPFAYNLDQVGDPGMKRDKYRLSLHMDWEVLGHTVSSMTAYNKDDTMRWTDGDSGPATPFRTVGPVVGGGTFPFDTFTTRTIEKFEDFQQELRIASSSDQRFTYLFGAYFIRLISRNCTDNPVVPASTNAALNIRQRSCSFGNSDIENTALFGQLAYEITDTLTASFDARYQWDDVTFLSKNFRPAVPAFVSLNETFTAFLPRFTLDYKPSENLTFYGIVSKGNQPGGFNADPRLPESLRTFAEEELWNYEIGVKSSWLDNSLQANVALFHMDWSQQQLRRSIDVTQPGGIPALVAATTNAGKSKVDGVEVELNFAPTDNWFFRVAGAYNRGRFVSFCSEFLFRLTGIQGNDGCGAGFASVKGNKFEAAPEWSGSISTGYNGQLAGEWRWFGRADLTFVGNKYDSEMNLAWTGDALKLNLTLGVENGGLRLEAFARNLFDDRTPGRVARLSDYRAGFDVRANQSVAWVPARPRQFGVQASYAF